MGDEATEIQPTLTSTMGNVLLSQNNDRNDANDSTPTSSTDAASSYSATSSTTTDDPISSTSSDVSEKNKVADNNEEIDVSKGLAAENDVDLLDINIANVSSETINEEMEDIVQDLQKILGESESIDDLPPKRRTIRDNSSDDNCSLSLDDLGSGKDGINETSENFETGGNINELDASAENLEHLLSEKPPSVDNTDLKCSRDVEQNDSVQQDSKVTEISIIETVQQPENTSVESSAVENDEISNQLEFSAEKTDADQVEIVINESQAMEQTSNVDSNEKSHTLDLTDKSPKEPEKDEKNENTIKSSDITEHDSNTVPLVTQISDIPEKREDHQSEIEEIVEVEAKSQFHELENTENIEISQAVENPSELSLDKPSVVDIEGSNFPEPITTSKKISNELTEGVISSKTIDTIITTPESNPSISVNTAQENIELETSVLVPTSNENVESVVSEETEDISTQNVGSEVENVEDSAQIYKFDGTQTEKEESPISVSVIEEDIPKSSSGASSETYDDLEEKSKNDTSEKSRSPSSVPQEMLQNSTEFEIVREINEEKEVTYSSKNETSEIASENSTNIVEGSFSSEVSEKIAESIPLTHQTSIEEPSEPLIEEPSNPLIEEPSEPLIQEPADPLIEEPSEPPIEEPSEPIIEEPSEPIDKELSETLTEEPSAPLIEELSEPLIEESAEANIEEPSEPQDSSESLIEEPSESLSEEPVEPLIEEPSEPPDEESSEPVIGKSSEPLIEESSEPPTEGLSGLVEPSEPSIEKSSEPLIEKPSEPPTEELSEPLVKHSEPMIEESSVPLIKEPSELLVEDSSEQLIQKPSESLIEESSEISRINIEEVSPDLPVEELSKPVIEECPSRELLVEKQSPLIEEVPESQTEKISQTLMQETGNEIGHIAVEKVRDQEQHDNKTTENVMIDNEICPKAPIPVVEEICVKKTIIYKHDCSQIGEHIHKEPSPIDTIDKGVSDNIEGLEDSIEKEEGKMTLMNESLQIRNLEHKDDSFTTPTETVGLSEDTSHQVIEEKNEKEANTQFISTSDTSNILEKESKFSEPIISKPPIQSAINYVEKTEISPTLDKQEFQTLPSVSAKKQIHTEVDEAVKHIVIDDKIHDQTTAAVQSILDNMLAEEQNIVDVSEKEESALVHSSYSSYELQKAVLQIQGIPSEDHTDDMCHEGLSFATGAEKNVESNHNVHPVLIETLDQNTKESIERKIIQESTPTQVNTEIVNLQKSEIQSCDFKDTQSIVQDVRRGIQDEVCEKFTDESSGTAQKESEISLVQPSIDLSEESSSEESLEEANTQSSSIKRVATPTQIEEKVIDRSKNIPSDQTIPKKVITKDSRQSKSSERTKDKPYKGSINEPLSINVDVTEKEKNFSPRITIKPIREEEPPPPEDKEGHKGSLKITITKQSDNTHSILKICSPDMEQRHKHPEMEEQNIVPKLVIKTADVEQHSPKMSTRSKQGMSTAASQRSGSPRITIKPIIKPESPIGSPLKITIKPMGKPEEFSKQQQQRHSPKLPRNRNEDDHYGTRSKVMKIGENSEVHSPKVTIKPVLKPQEELELQSPPKITIKPIEKPEIEARVSPKITIKPVIKPPEENDVDDEVKQRIVLKINKGTIPSKESEKGNRKREYEEEKSEKLAKIKLKFSKGGDAHIVHEDTEQRHSPSSKRTHEIDSEKSKRLRGENLGYASDEDVKIIEDRQSPIIISEDSRSQDSVILVEEARDPLADIPPIEPRIIPAPVPVLPPAPKRRGRPRKVPLVIREEFTNVQKIDIPLPAPNPIVEPSETESTGRPKRSCRGQSVRDTLGIKPRKPKAPPKARGGKRGSGAKGVTKKKGQEFSGETIELIRQNLTEEAIQNAKSSGISKFSKKNQGINEPLGQPFELKGLLQAAKDQNIIEVIEIDSPSNSPKIHDDLENLPANTEETPELIIGASEVEMQPPTPMIVPHLSEPTPMDMSHSSDIAIFEEETRMSAEVNSRAQTPAKQVVSTDVVEESQSSMQSTATTESGKISRKSRLEVHQEPDTAIVTADQLNEYYWGGNGPFMLQEQVAQFLGIKSFKRKYPGIARRMVDMQERDYIRENGLASESMCDLGLTAVNSADILDIMYSDFQDKYEEYCKYQRDKQAKDLINKQKALTLASGQEKNKLDIMEQAMQSAAAFNVNFNKTRREQRRACMDLQTMNVHYPKGNLRKIHMPKIGHYPVSVVPGQYTDYYKEFTPTEINNLPLNTMLYKELQKVLPEVSDSESDSSGSESDESSSSGSDSESSCDDSCKECVAPTDKKSTIARKSPIHAGI